MTLKSTTARKPAEQVIKDIRRATRRHFSAEDKIQIVLDGLRGEDSTAAYKAAIVTRTILGLARRMGLTVCAEGVEDPATFDVMAKWGCHKIQGFYIGRPAPSAALDFDGYKQWASGRSQGSTG